FEDAAGVVDDDARIDTRVWNRRRDLFELRRTIESEAIDAVVKELPDVRSSFDRGAVDDLVWRHAGFLEHMEFVFGRGLEAAAGLCESADDFRLRIGLERIVNRRPR